MMKTILLVEDDKSTLLYKQELSLEGYNITAQDGQEAIKKVKEHTQTFVMDINMPKINGIEAIGKILSEHKDYPLLLTLLIAVTG
jgi:CheY-like chemotaxis protein